MEEEQINKDVSVAGEADEVKNQAKKQKDPKKVAAGKALARKNAEARKISEVDVKELPSEPLAGSRSDPSLSFFDFNNEIQTAAGFVGAGFVLYHGWKFFTSSMNNSDAGEASKASHGSVAKQAKKAKQAKQSNMIDMD